MYMSWSRRSGQSAAPVYVVQGASLMTPTELAREAGLERRDVISKCMELGIPIFQGKIDKTLFMSYLDDGQC